MIELIVLIMLSKRNGKRAKEKGYSSGFFIFLTITFYLVGEIIGGIIGYAIVPEDSWVYYPIALLGGITGGVISSLIVLNLQSKSLTNSAETASFYPEEPDATWECPSCNQENKNTTFKCVNCSYKIQ